MLTKVEAWIQIFLAALQAIIATGQHTHSNALAQARAVADEGILHLPAGALVEDAAPRGLATAPDPIALAANHAMLLDKLQEAVTQPADEVKGDQDDTESDLERDRR